MYDLVTIGDIVLDLFFQGKSLTTDKDRFSLSIGGKYLADSFYQGVGGGAANVAIDAIAHDLDVAVCGLVGENSLKQLIIQHLVKKNVSTELLIFERDFINISTILLSETGEKTVIHYPTPDVPFVIPSQLESSLAQAKAYFVGHLPQATLKNKIAIMQTLLKTGAPIFLNLGLDDCALPLSDLKPLLSQAHTLILNAYELAELIKKKKEDISLESNPAKIIGFEDKLLIITDAENGSYAYHKNQVYHQKAVKVEKIVDTTGVGDAYTASFIASFMTDADIQKSMLVASQFASKKLSRLGAN